MAYKVIYHWSDGTDSEEEQLFDTEEEANEAGLYGLGCARLGGEILEMSNPGDYPFDPDDYDDDDFEVVEV